jgi:hypothetical protein
MRAFLSFDPRSGRAEAQRSNFDETAPKLWNGAESALGTFA